MPASARCGIGAITEKERGRICDFGEALPRHLYTFHGCGLGKLLDPLTHRAFCYTPGEMHEVLDGILRTKDPDIAVPLAEIFET